MRRVPSAFRLRPVALAGLGAALALLLQVRDAAADPRDPVTPAQRAAAQHAAAQGVPLSELAPNAPDSYTVRRGDTLWRIAGLFLRSPWRWPELWGMNATEIRNPHLIYPGQVLYLDKSNGRARLRSGRPVGYGVNGTERLSPRVRATDLAADALPSIPFSLIEPFLNEAVIFDSNALESAPRIVATQEGRVVLGRGDRAYVRGDVSGGSDYRIFREPKPLKDPDSGEVLGYEAVYVGTAEYVRQGETRVLAENKTEVVPATFMVTSVRREAGVGDRLALVPAREYTNYVPHAPEAAVDGRVVSMYGDALTGGQNQIVALNRGAHDGIERGHVLALWRKGQRVVDPTDPGRATVLLPDERDGLLFVFRVFDRMSYALIVQATEPVAPGDRFTQP